MGLGIISFIPHFLAYSTFASPVYAEHITITDWQFDYFKISTIYESHYGYFC